jgi:hypothetical protein
MAAIHALVCINGGIVCDAGQVPPLAALRENQDMHKHSINYFLKQALAVVMLKNHVVVDHPYLFFSSRGRQRGNVIIAC